MADQELITIWKQFRLIHELFYRSGLSVESLRRTLKKEYPELSEEIDRQETMASQDYAPKHAELLRLIDDTIRRLESDDT